MNLTTNIILWTVSITLAVFGILFGIIASYNAKKANTTIEDLIKTRGFDEDGRKFFFDKMKSTIAANKKSIKALEGNITYFDYSIALVNARFPFVDSQSIAKFDNSEFADLMKKFLASKKILDKSFSDSVGGLDKLASQKIMSVSKKNKLLTHHNRVVKVSTEIIREYTLISKQTKTIKIK